jgi:hypothetical protein
MIVRPALCIHKRQLEIALGGAILAAIRVDIAFNAV